MQNPLNLGTQQVVLKRTLFIIILLHDDRLTRLAVTLKETKRPNDSRNRTSNKDIKNRFTLVC